MTKKLKAEDREMWAECGFTPAHPPPPSPPLVGLCPVKNSRRGMTILMTLSTFTTIISVFTTFINTYHRGLDLLVL